MFHHRSRIRTVAVHLLLLWVFALGAGVVHACGLAPKTHSADPIGQASPAGAAHHHANAGAGDGNAMHLAGKAACLKFCDDAKAVSSVPDTSGDASAAGVAPLWPVLRPDTQAGVALITAQARAHRDRPPLPIAIEYLRLAL
ncbi:MAG: hypothetical protein KIT60_20270 [Burkholderiaceae bacterium]|nr:hypothetical protein [Burkholderiaceae bacterium]